MIENLDVATSAYSFQEEAIRGKTAVMIDVLRASSTMVTALGNGASGIIPVADMEEARGITQNLESSEFLMSGENNGRKIDGYDLTNSPLVHDSDAVRDKTVVLNTTNGTQAVDRMGYASTLVIGSFLNMQSIINYLKQVDTDIVLVCAGWRGRLSFEDLLCAGNIIYELCSGNLPETAKDGARVAFGLFEKFGDDMEGNIKTSDYSERLDGVVSEKDIAFCCRHSIIDILPVFKEGVIKTHNGTEQ